MKIPCTRCGCTTLFSVQKFKLDKSIFVCWLLLRWNCLQHTLPRSVIVPTRKCIEFHSEEAGAHYEKHRSLHYLDRFPTTRQYYRLTGPFSAIDGLPWERMFHSLQAVSIPKAIAFVLTNPSISTRNNYCSRNPNHEFYYS